MILFMIGNIAIYSQQLVDSYADGNFTANPVWGGNSTDWTIVTNSTSGPNQTGSNTLRLNVPSGSGTKYLSTQIQNWGTIQEWGFWAGRRDQGLTMENQMHIWLYANESNLNSGTVDGYRLTIGDNTGGDEIRLEYIVNSAVVSTVITSVNNIPNGLTDISFFVRVTRTSSGVWTLYSSSLPTATGNGVSSLLIPNSTNASVNQGTSTHNVLPPSTNGYLGVLAIHTFGVNALVSVEFDQVYLTTNSNIVNFAGTIFHKGNNVAGVKDVTVTLSGDNNDSKLTGVSGSYNLNSNTGVNFVITPVKNINLLNGVDVADATRISQHMAGNYLTDFYRKVSADVNKSSTISTVDASLIKQALLGNPAAIAIFTATGSWRFVDTDFSPPGSASFVVPTFPSTRTYTSASGNYTAQDFYGMKIGDVLDNANPQNLTSGRIPAMVWMAREQNLNSGETIDVEFSVQNWNNIAAFQYELKFDPSVLEFENLEMLQSIIDFNKEENFGISNIQNGKLKVIFTSTNGSEVEVASKVFKLRFKVLQSATKLSDVLSLSNTELKPIAYTENLISTDLKLVFIEGSVSNSDDQNELEKVELLQNRPNPFSDFTSIGFILPTAMDARLNIYDATGRMIWKVEKFYPGGYNEEKIRLDETWIPAVYFYELSTKYGSHVNRMFIIRE